MKDQNRAPGSLSASSSAKQNLQRRHPVHGTLGFAYQPTIVCVTVCTHRRSPWLDNDDVRNLLFDVWEQADVWRVGRYVIMPEHIHLFAGEFGDLTIESWVRYWKSQFTKRHGDRQHRWQTDHWDRRVRSQQEYERAWNYIHWNPVRAELVDHPEEWPYSGMIYDLRWE